MDKRHCLTSISYLPLLSGLPHRYRQLRLIPRRAGALCLLLPVISDVLACYHTADENTLINVLPLPEAFVVRRGICFNLREWAPNDGISGITEVS